MNRILALSLLFISAFTFAQPEVGSTTFQLMLKGLLSHTVPEVSVEQIAEEEDVIFLDAREKSEYEISHIENAIWIGYDDFELSRVKDLNKDARIVVYCSVGYRSEKISEKLLTAGFTNISNLYGGIFEWGNQGKPVVNDAGRANEIHPYDSKWGLWLSRELRATDY